METVTPTSPMVVPPLSYDDLLKACDRQRADVASWGLCVGRYVLEPDKDFGYGFTGAQMQQPGLKGLAEATVVCDRLDAERRRRFAAMRLGGRIR